jgi:hypothetical protein
MDKEMEKFWQEAESNLGQSIDIGDHVCCDLCSEDYTNSDEKGGFLFLSKDVCPKCAPKFLTNVTRYQETQFIRAQAEEGETFKTFILRIRGGYNTIKISKLA